MDGIAIRLPTVCVRPGEPNLAASGFFSGIIREPLHGRPAILPVSPDVRHWFASPRAFDPRRACALGFRAEASFDEIVRVYVDDELGGRIAGC